MDFRIWRILAEQRAESTRRDHSTRKDILEIVERWVKVCLEELNISSNHIRQISIIFAYGSQALKIVSRDTDLNLLCLIPDSITKARFHEIFEAKLRTNRDVENTINIPKARFPLVTFNYLGINVKFLAVSINEHLMKNQHLMWDWKVAKQMTKEDYLTWNGYHIATNIQRLIPNQDTFALALSAIKLWAQRKKIYGAKYGYLGGLSWTILLLNVADRYPRATAFELLERFFATYATWSWPEPVKLMIGQIDSKNKKKTYRIKDWDPSDIRNSSIMPILTPAVPLRDSGQLVTGFTRETITNEIRNALRLMDQNNFQGLFDKLRFLESYDNFLIVTATNTVDFNEISWILYAEGKIRSLLVDMSYMNLVSVRLLPQSYKSKTNEQELYFIFGLLHNCQSIEDNLKSKIELFKYRFTSGAREASRFRWKVSLSTRIVDKDSIEASLPADIYSDLKSE